MTTSSPAAAVSANRPPAKAGNGIPETGDFSAALVRYFNGFSKPYAYLMGLLGLSEKTAKNRAYGDRAFTDDDIAALLRSEHWLDVIKLAHAAGPPGYEPPASWQVVEALIEDHDARRTSQLAVRKAERALRKALDADESVSAALERAATARAVHRAHVARREASTDRPMGGLPRGAVVAAGRRG